jgi:adenosylhomocysteine nucleosidase
LASERSGNRLVGELLDEWRRRGWRDRDDAALNVAGALLGGASAAEAAQRVSRTMLDANNITRAQVQESLARIVQTVELRGRRDLMVVVLTAIEAEFQAVLSQLADPESTLTDHGTEYAVGRVGGSVDCTVAVARIGPGNLGAATEVATAVQRFRPAAVLFVGVAGGVKANLAIGDVVVASRVHYYEGGRAEADKFKARPLSFPTSHRLEQLAASVARDFPAPVHIKPVAAGEALVGSSDSEIARIVNEHYNDTVAVDMESAGLYDAAHRLDLVCLAIRGVSDKLDDKDPAADLRNQPLAAENAARFMSALLTASRVAEVFEKGGNGGTRGGGHP